MLPMSRHTYTFHRGFFQKSAHKYLINSKIGDEGDIKGALWNITTPLCFVCIMADVEKSYQWLKARDSDDRSGVLSDRSRGKGI